jgi:Acyl-CoA reductase (LuxC)
MILKERIEALLQLGKELTPDNDRLQSAIRCTQQTNGWLTVENQWHALNAIRTYFLDRARLNEWIAPYNIPENEPANPKTVSLVLAGNIPAVGFHDVLCVFVAGHKAKIKVSDKDPFLMPCIINNLIDINPAAAAYFEVVEGKMGDFDAVIATGSNNSARYFQSYFGKYPHIIRKNRNAVAILRGDENEDDFRKLGADIFTYFGLGCRNVSKIYVPQSYNFEPLLEILHENKELVLHDKYKNNFDYQFTLVILNKLKYQSNGCIMMIENEGIASPIAMVFYEYYADLEGLTHNLTTRADEIQCVVSKQAVVGIPSFDFGEAQKPRLTDYADGVDTLAFLLTLN